MVEWRNHIAADPEVMYGKPCIKGTRIPVDLVLEKLAAGQPIDDLLAGYPQLTLADVQACLSYGAASVRNDLDLPYAS